MNLTLPDEHIAHGTARELHKKHSGLEKKGEFVIVIEGHGNDPAQRMRKGR
jgi:16S rRNA C1402 (ribose-2'-O) methylase RsmI